MAALAPIFSACTDIVELSAPATPARTFLATQPQLMQACADLAKDGVVCQWPSDATNPAAHIVGHLAIPDDRDPRWGTSKNDPNSYFFAWVRLSSGPVVDGYQLWQGTITTAWSASGYYTVRHGFDDIAWRAVNARVRTIGVGVQSTELQAWAQQQHADDAKEKRDADAKAAEDAKRAEQKRIEEEKQLKARFILAQKEEQYRQKHEAEERVRPRWYIIEPERSTCEPLDYFVWNSNRVAGVDTPDKLIDVTQQISPYHRFMITRNGEDIAVVCDLSDGVGGYPMGMFRGSKEACLKRVDTLNSLVGRH